MKYKGRITATLAVATVLVLVAPLSATAYTTTIPVSGQLNSGGSLVQYGTYHWHAQSGSAGLNVTSNIVGGYSSFGLRNKSNVQTTNSRTWANGGTGANSNTGLKWFTTTGGSSNIPGSSYLAINGRMSLVGGGTYNINWAGTLYI